MMYAGLDGNFVILTTDATDTAFVSKLPGIQRVPKMPPGTWRMPLTFEAVDILRKNRILCSPLLVRECRRLIAARAYIENIKSSKVRPIPLAPLPVKDSITLYDHQISAYNIALALMGYNVT